MNKDDAVNHPRHYTSHPSGVECIELVENMSFCVGNTLKYVFRSDEKGAPLQDVKKALWYLEREIERRQRWADPRTRQELAVAAFLDHEPRPHIRAAVEALWRAAIVTTGTVEDLVAARQHIQNELSTRHADERAASSSNTQEAPKKRKATRR